MFTKSFQVHVERGRLTSFLKSAELLKVHGLCDQIDSAEQVTSNVASNTEQPKKTIIKKSKRNSKPVTATISPAFAPLKNRNSPKPSTSSNQRISSSPGISVKMEEPNFPSTLLLDFIKFSAPFLNVKHHKNHTGICKPGRAISIKSDDKVLGKFH